VVGAEPGDRRGITAADPADLSQGIDAFQGADRPSRTMHYDDRGGLPVLVLTVAAPRWGDPAFTLFKDLPRKPRLSGKESGLCGVRVPQSPDFPIGGRAGCEGAIPKAGVRCR
jgi:hypothetical protein